jgi:hypothetical protein
MSKLELFMIQIKKIVISGEGFLNDADFNNIADANLELCKRRYKAPEKGNGYLKQHCKFIFEDGKKISLRVDLTSQSSTEPLSTEIEQLLNWLKSDPSNDLFFLIGNDYEGFNI